MLHEVTTHLLWVLDYLFVIKYGAWTDLCESMHPIHLNGVRSPPVFLSNIHLTLAAISRLPIQFQSKHLFFVHWSIHPLTTHQFIYPICSSTVI